MRARTRDSLVGGSHFYPGDQSSLYVYDYAAHGAGWTYTHPERGPPSAPAVPRVPASQPPIALGADRLLARSAVVAIAGSTTYDIPIRTCGLTSGSTAAPLHIRATRGDRSSLLRLQVAAKSADEVVPVITKRYVRPGERQLGRSVRQFTGNRALIVVPLRSVW